MQMSLFIKKKRLLIVGGNENQSKDIKNKK